MTLRQIFYRLVGAYGYDKTEKAYGRLGEHVNRARRARLIPFSAIRDDGITSTHPMAWDSPEALIRMFVRGAGEFRLDRQQGQPRRLIFAIEAAGMIPMVENVADPFGISAVSCGGFDSTTNKYDLATSLGRWRQVEVLHIGDHDPSGIHCSRRSRRTYRPSLAISGSISTLPLHALP